MVTATPCPHPALCPALPPDCCPRTCPTSQTHHQQPLCCSRPLGWLCKPGVHTRPVPGVLASLCSKLAAEGAGDGWRASAVCTGDLRGWGRQVHSRTGRGREKGTGKDRQSHSLETQDRQVYKGQDGRSRDRWFPLGSTQYPPLSLEPEEKALKPVAKQGKLSPGHPRPASHRTQGPEPPAGRGFRGVPDCFPLNLVLGQHRVRTESKPERGTWNRGLKV